MPSPGRRIVIAIVLAAAAFAVAGVIYCIVLSRRLSAEVAGRPWRYPTEIYAADGMHALDVYGGSWQITPPVLLDDLPGHVPAAFIAAEDVRFRRHFGVDPIGIARASFANLRKRRIAQGASTITQQLVRTKVLGAERSLTRKIPEAILAVGLELRASKDDILEAYLNDVYLGHSAGDEVRGIGEAARLYLDKPPERLTAGEAALLASMVRAPNRDTPEKRPDVVRRRRDGILKVLRKKRWIEERHYEAGLREAVRLDPGRLPPTPYQYYLAALRSEVTDRIGERRVARGGLKIYSGLDPLLQISTEKAARNGTRFLGRRHAWLRRSDSPLQAAVLSIDPRTGQVRALVGGSDYRESKLDRTALMRRQPGSTFKPFVYLAAIESRQFTAATPLRDEPMTVKLARNDVWRPQNYDERYHGSVTLREAFEKSLNVPAVRVAQEVGTRAIHRVTDEAGFGDDLSSTPAIALGVSEVSIRELTSAFTVFPNLGIRRELYFAHRIENRTGRKLYEHRPEEHRVANPSAAYVLHSLLRGVVLRGTASGLHLSGLGHTAGKTGTTSNFRDAWFVGYTRELLTTVWVGFDEAQPLRLSSAESALPLWAAVMRVRPGSPADVPPPAGVAAIAIEPGSGRRWRDGCGERFIEFFIEGTEPGESCRGDELPYVVAGYQEPAVISGPQLERSLRSEASLERRSSGMMRRRSSSSREEMFRELSRSERRRLRRLLREHDFEDDDYEKILEKRAEELRAEMREWKRKKHDGKSKDGKRRGRDRDDDDDDDDDEDDD